MAHDPDLPHDQNGRPFASKHELREGDQIEVNAGRFGCLDETKPHLVQIGKDGRLFVICVHGQHHLDASLDPSGTWYKGIYCVARPPHEQTPQPEPA